MVLDKSTARNRDVDEVFNEALAVQVFKVDPNGAFLRYVRPVEEHEPLRCQDEQVDGAFPERPSFFPQCGFQSPDLHAARFKGLKSPVNGASHEGLQRFLVHHVLRTHSWRIRKRDLYYRIGDIHVEAAYQDEITHAESGCVRGGVGHAVGIVIGIVRIIPGEFDETPTGIGRGEDLLNDFFSFVVFQVAYVKAVAGRVVAVEEHLAHKRQDRKVQVSLFPIAFGTERDTQGREFVGVGNAFQGIRHCFYKSLQRLAVHNFAGKSRPEVVQRDLRRCDIRQIVAGCNNDRLAIRLVHTVVRYGESQLRRSHRVFSGYEDVHIPRYGVVIAGSGAGQGKRQSYRYRQWIAGICGGDRHGLGTAALSDRRGIRCQRDRISDVGHIKVYPGAEDDAPAGCSRFKRMYVAQLGRTGFLVSRYRWIIVLVFHKA